MIKLDEAVARANQTALAALRGVSGGLGEMTSHLAQSAGKGARTQVLLNAAMGADGLIPENAPKAAAAVELLHMATLVHDDVIDDAPTRRGLPTVQKAFGKKSAVICGDYLLCVSLSAITSMERMGGEDAYEPLAARFSAALADICKGEYSQHLNEGNLDLELFTYLKIIAGKTAALFYVSAYLGGLIGGEGDKAARALGRYGQAVGMVFQMMDDCKDYEFTEAEAQKPVGNDIRGGVITLPLIVAMQKDPALRDLARSAMETGRDIPRLLEATRAAGGTDAARAVAKRYEQRALAALRFVHGQKRDNLAAILQKTMAAAKTF